MTKKKAIEYSLIKWQYAKRTGCTEQQLANWIDKNQPDISTIQNECGLCEKYMVDNDIHLWSDRSGLCVKCPLAKADFDCFTHKGLYRKWARGKNVAERKKIATKLYKVIEGL